LLHLMGVFINRPPSQMREKLRRIGLIFMGSCGTAGTAV
jgi:hypothetical protein